MQAHGGPHIVVLIAVPNSVKFLTQWYQSQGTQAHRVPHIAAPITGNAQTHGFSHIMTPITGNADPWFSSLSDTNHRQIFYSNDNVFLLPYLKYVQAKRLYPSIFIHVYISVRKERDDTHVDLAE